MILMTELDSAVVITMGIIILMLGAAIIIMLLKEAKKGHRKYKGYKVFECKNCGYKIASTESEEVCKYCGKLMNKIFWV